jgi:hypothetical protein
MSKKNNKKAKKGARPSGHHAVVSLTGRFFLWLLLWFGALIFTQALRSVASNIFFGFVSSLPLASFIYALIGRATLKTFMLSNSTVTEKNRPFTYEFRLINESILPYPFIEAYTKLPRRNSVRTQERCVKVSMSPLSNYTVKGEVKFRFRGTYEIGVSSIYIYDFFRMIRIRSDFNSYDTIYVLPRKLILDTEDALSVSDSATRTKTAPYVYDRLEVSDIRDYRPGDSLKSIHWNLSSKNEEFVVRDYNTGSTDVSFVFCDMSAHFPDEAPILEFVNPYEVDEEQTQAPASPSAETDGDGAESTESTESAPTAVAETRTAVKAKKKRKSGESIAKEQMLINDEAYDDMNEYCADGAVELTIAVVLRELRAGREVVLMWYDDRSEIGAFSYDLRSVEDFDTIFRLFSSAPSVDGEQRNIARLVESVGDTNDAKLLIVLPALDRDTVADVCAIPRVSEVIAYSAEERYLYPETRRDFIEGCREQFSKNGITFVDGKIDESKILGSESALEGDEPETNGEVGFGIRKKGGQR